MEKINYELTINGKTYPARFTVRVAILAAERRGGSLSALFRNQNQAEFFEDMIWLAVELIKAGALLKEKETGEKTENIPNLEELLDTIDQADLLELQAAMLAVINKDKPTVHAEASRKNAEATPET